MKRENEDVPKEFNLGGRFGDEGGRDLAALDLLRGSSLFHHYIVDLLLQYLIIHPERPIKQIEYIQSPL